MVFSGGTKFLFDSFSKNCFFGRGIGIKYFLVDVGEWGWVGGYMKFCPNKL